MKIYVAGASAERALVGHFIDKLRNAGIEITLDWVAEIDANGGLSNEGLTEKQRLGAAVADRDAVLRADIIWLMVPRAVSIGAWVELGVALGANEVWRRDDELEGPSGRHVRIVVSGVYDRSIFTSLASELREKHEDAFKDIVEMAKMDTGPS